MHDEALRLYRVSMRLDVTGLVLASSEEEARDRGLAKQWAIDPAQMPDLDSVKAHEEVMERVTGSFPVN
jgi:hypothetical protein